jgi:outer membrane protein
VEARHAKGIAIRQSLPATHCPPTEDFMGMNATSWICAIGFVALAGAIGWQAASRPKVGIVDNGRLMGQFGEAIRARRTLDSVKASMDANAKHLADSLDAAVTALKGGYEAGTVAEKQKLRAEVTEWNLKLANYRKSTQALYEAKEQELILPVLSKMTDFIQTWGKQRGYDAILGSGMQGGVVLMVEDGMDVTSKVLVDLNALYGASPPALLPAPAADSQTAQQVSSAK